MKSDQIMKIYYPRRVEEISQNLALRIQSAPWILGGGGTNSIKKLEQQHSNQQHRNYSRPKIIEWYISTFNIRTMSTEDKLVELEQELNKIKWTAIGLSEVRRPGEGCKVLKSGHVLFYKGREELKEGGVGILINKKIAQNITQFKAISDRVILIEITINRRTKCKLIQVYAPTATHEDEEVEQFYEEVNTAIKSSKTRYMILMGDFNAKIGKKERDMEDENEVGPYGIGTRNSRGFQLINYAKENNLYIMNSFFKKPESRRWTWCSPDGSVKNEIDYIISNDKNIVKNTTVLNAINVGSDHRMIRARIIINTKKERRQMVNNKKMQIDHEQLKIKAVEYQKIIAEDEIPQMKEEELNTLNTKITECLLNASKKIATKGKDKKEKLSRDTLNLIEKRRQLQGDRTNNRTEIAELNKTIKTKIRADLRKYKNSKVKQTLEEGKSLKDTLRKTNEGNYKIVKLINDENKEITQSSEIEKTIEKYYQSLYKTKVQPPIGKTENQRPIVKNVGSEEIPEITVEEIESVVKNMSNKKAPGEDNIIVEMIKYGGKPILKQLKILYNKCLTECKIPDDWLNALVVLIFKKGNKFKLQNYRPISLLSILYKIFTKIITQRLANKLDSYQPREQAGFRKAFSTLDHLQVMRVLIEKSNEYNMALWIAVIDYEKAFDSVEIWAVLNALSNSRIDSRYTSLIQYIYKNATMQVTTPHITNKIKIQCGVRQGDSISPKLFTAALEDVFKELEWESKGITIDGEKLHHLRFADDVVLIANNKEELQEMLNELNEKSREIGLKINLNKTKYLTNEIEPLHEQQIIIEQGKIEKVESCIYLGQKIELSKNNLKIDLNRRIALAWSAFGRLQSILKSNIPNTLKARTFDQYILPVLTYGTETWSFNKSIIDKLQKTQRAMERRMLNIKLQDHIPNIEIRRRSKVTDVIQRICTLRWNWAGHIGRMKDDRWTRRILEWRPRANKRSRGRPQTRWTDDIKRIAGYDWLQKTQNRDLWKALGEAYVRRWTE